MPSEKTLEKPMFLQMRRLRWENVTGVKPAARQVCQPDENAAEVAAYADSRLGQFPFLFGLGRGAVVFVQFVAEGADADVQHLGGVGAVAFAASKRGENVVLLQIRQRGKLAAVPARVRARR